MTVHRPQPPDGQPGDGLWGFLGEPPFRGQSAEPGAAPGAALWPHMLRAVRGADA
jgi:hypothetical protein